MIPTNISLLRHNCNGTVAGMQEEGTVVNEGGLIADITDVFDDIVSYFSS